MVLTWNPIPQSLHSLAAAAMANYCGLLPAYEVEEEIMTPKARGRRRVSAAPPRHLLSRKPFFPAQPVKVSHVSFFS